MNEIDAAVDAVLSKSDVGRYLIGGGYVLDLTMVVADNRFTALVVKGVHATERHKRTTMRTAILLARPERG